MDRGFFIVGSLNIDLNTTVDRFPEAGQTVRGSAFSTNYGGKGANQAVALARLCGTGSNRVRIAGKLGKDAYGAQYLSYLREMEVETSTITTSEQSTGIALIEIDGEGRNRIVVVSGANGEATEHWWEEITPAVGQFEGQTFLLQLEIPLQTVFRVIRQIHAHRGLVLLDPAPAAGLPDDLWHSIDVITPNQTETEFYTGIYPTNDDEARRAGDVLLKKGVSMAVIKAGACGSWLLSPAESWFCPVFPVKVEDTTAAGDSFNAGFAYALAEGHSMGECLRFANAVGGLATTRKGAQSAMPDLDTVEGLLRAWPKIGPRQLK